MNSPPFGYFANRQRAQMHHPPPRRQAWQGRHAIVPPEVHTARAFARLAGLDLDEIGIGGRPRCVAASDDSPTPNKKPGFLQRSLVWARTAKNRAMAWVKKTFGWKPAS